MSHLTFDERVRICLLVTEGYRQNEIAARLNRSPSTISRELRRNRHPSGQYQACEAGRFWNGKLLVATRLSLPLCRSR